LDTSVCWTLSLTVGMMSSIVGIVTSVLVSGIGPVPSERMDTCGAPKPAASDVRSWSYLSWSTWLIAYRTMKSATRTVIMSA
jgi:hypothetical protein